MTDHAVGTYSMAAGTAPEHFANKAFPRRLYRHHHCLQVDTLFLFSVTGFQAPIQRSGEELAHHVDGSVLQTHSFNTKKTTLPPELITK